MASLVEWLMKTEMYRIVFSNDAKKDLKELSKKAPLSIDLCIVALIYLIDSYLYVNHLRHLEQVILIIALIINYLIIGFHIPFSGLP